MHNANYDYYQCHNCTAFDSSVPDRRYCKKHNFVMPRFNDYLVCADWHFVSNVKVGIPFGDSLKNDILYWWNDIYYPHPVDRFELIQELRLHLQIAIAPHPKHAWLILIPSWDADYYPAPGSTISLQLDDKSASFTLIDEEIDVYYTTAAADKKRRVEMRKEQYRVAVPPRAHVQLFTEWIDRHFGIEGASQRYHSDELCTIKEALRLHGRIAGIPDRGSLTLKAGVVRESANSDTELDDGSMDG